MPEVPHPAITRDILVDVAPDSDLGPKMLALNERQRAFVTAMLDNGGKWQPSLAARLAGYSGNDRTMSVTGHRLAHSLNIQEAIHEEAGRRLHSGKAMAVSQLLSIAQNAIQDKDRLKAIGMILNRTGMHETSEHKVTTRDESKTDSAMIARIQHLAGVLGVDPTKLLGHNGPKTKPAKAGAEDDEQDVVEAEFTEVVDDEPPASAEGLEDIL